MNDQPQAVPDRSHRAARFFSHVHRYKNVVRQRWWVLPLTLMLGLGVQGYRIWKAPPLFASFGRMIVSVKINTQLGSVYSEEMSQFLGTQVALMKSVRVREKAYDRVKALKPNLTRVPVLLQITVSPKTTIFNLQATGRDPEYTRAYLDACMEEYISLKNELRATPTEATLEGIMGQLAALERELKKYSEEEVAFKATNDVVFLQEQVNSIATYLVQKSRQRDTLRSDLNLLKMFSLDMNLQRLQQDEAMPAAGNDNGQGSTPLNVLNADYLREKQQLQMLKAEMKEWSEVLRPKHPRMIAMKDEISRRERLLDILKDQGKEQVDSQRDAVSLQITNVEREIKELDARSLDLSAKLSAYDRIRDNKQRTQALYDKLFAAMQTLGVDKQINPESVTVLERAEPAVPAGDNPITMLIIGAVVGLLAGLGILLLVDRLDDRPASMSDLQEMFDEPVLGQVPFEHGKDRRGVIQLIRPDDDRHAFLEAYRNLRSSLLYMGNEGQRPRILLVTSAIPSDGKSMTAANLAIIMSLSGSRVLLVDGDLRKGLLHLHFGVPAAPGFSEALQGQVDWHEALQATTTANLSLLPRGNIAHNPSEMFLSAATLKFIQEVGAEYDYVVIDTAPVMAADDVTSLAPRVEGVVFVVRASFTSARVARAALDLLYQRDVNVLGFAFNAVKTDSAEYYYYHYKDYYTRHQNA